MIDSPVAVLSLLNDTPDGDIPKSAERDAARELAPRLKALGFDSLLVISPIMGDRDEDEAYARPIAAACNKSGLAFGVGCQLVRAITLVYGTPGVNGGAWDKLCPLALTDARVWTRVTDHAVMAREAFGSGHYFLEGEACFSGTAKSEYWTPGNVELVGRCYRQAAILLGSLGVRLCAFEPYVLPPYWAAQFPESARVLGGLADATRTASAPIRMLPYPYYQGQEAMALEALAAQGKTTSVMGYGNLKGGFIGGETVAAIRASGRAGWWHAGDASYAGCRL